MAPKKLLLKPENVRPMHTVGLKTTEAATERLSFYVGFFFCNVCVLTFKIIRIFINI